MSAPIHVHTTVAARRPCVSCGQPAHHYLNGDYPYCERCERERQDDTVRPIVYTYFRDTVGYMRNMRGTIAFSLNQLGFDQRRDDLTTRYGLLPVYQSTGGQYQGKFAFVSPDQRIIIVDEYAKIERFVTLMGEFFNAKLTAGGGE